MTDLAQSKVEHKKKDQPEISSKNGSNFKLKLLIALIIAFFVLSSIILYLLFLRSPGKIISATDFNAQLSPTPTPMPFGDITIPVLRKRHYKSSLGSQTLLSTNSNYKSYTTSYDSDDLRINALLTIPNEDMPLEGYPAIVFVHGYIPPDSYKTTGPQYSSYVDYLARNGYVVLKIDLRGHGDSEGEAGGGYFGADYVIDALNAYSALENADFVNRDKIGMWGHSMAGNILLRSAVVKQNIPAIDIWAGAVFTYADMLKYRINDSSYRPQPNETETRKKRFELFDIYGDFSVDSPFWSKFAPTNYLKDIKGSIELDHAVNDTTVNIGYSRDLAKLLKENNIDYVLNEYPSGGHNIEGSNFNLAMKNTVDFFNKHLK